jgi:uncharacterized OB-fold protein
MSDAVQPAPVVPDPTPTSQPFWDALAEGRVELQHCRSCSGWVYYPRSRCSHCLSEDLAWEEISGEGTLYTFTVARQPTTPAFSETENLLIAVVELDEGPHVTTSLEQVAIEDVVAGMRVKPCFVPTDGVTLLRYQPA